MTTHSTVSKTNENLVRTIKPPITDNKTNRDHKVIHIDCPIQINKPVFQAKSTSYEKADTIGSLGSNQLFEKVIR